MLALDVLKLPLEAFSDTAEFAGVCLFSEFSSSTSDFFSF